MICLEQEPFPTCNDLARSNLSKVVSTHLWNKPLPTGYKPGFLSYLAKGDCLGCVVFFLESNVLSKETVDPFHF